MIKSGWSEVDITPWLGVPLAGYFNLRKAEKVLDSLKVVSLYIENSENSFVIISCDLCFLDNAFVKEVKSLLKKVSNIKESQIMISTTHTHTGPLTKDFFGQKIDVIYLEMLKEKIVESFLKAQKNASPSNIYFTEGNVEGISFNRRYLMKDGKVITNPKKDNPDIIGPDGPVDRSVGLIKIEREDKESQLILMNFSLHLDTVGGNYVSSDFVGIIREILKKVYGKETYFIYLQGAAGDINHLDPDGRIQTYNLYNRIRIGRVLSGEIIKKLEFAERIENIDLKSLEKKIEINLRFPSFDEIEEAKKISRMKDKKTGNKDITSEDLASGSWETRLFYAEETLRLSKERKKKDEMSIQVLRIGNISFVGIPAEVFTEIGFEIKEKSPFPHTFIVELANGCFGYLPTKEAFKKGGYETKLNSYNRLSSDTEKKVILTSLSLLDKIYS